MCPSHTGHSETIRTKARSLLFTQGARPVLKKQVKTSDAGSSTIAPTYGCRSFCEPIPRYEIPESPMDPRTVKQLVQDELNLDGNPALNLASFVTTWMDPEANELMAMCVNKNFIDQDEYPQTQKIHERVVSMLAHLLNAPEQGRAVGTVTIGSSEAIMLGLLAHKRSWQHRRKAAGKPADRPNIIYGLDVHSCWEKFANYFEVEARTIELGPGKYVIGPDDVAPLVDENTIAVGAVVGTTYTGQMDDVAGIDALLQKLNAERDLSIPMHVDGASGGFVMPFVHPDEAWDFRLPTVRSINVSNHKYGLVYPGLGSLIFRDASDVPEDLVYKINYLGGEMENYSLNFSRGSALVMGQYYNFLRFGREGYRQVLSNCVETAQQLARTITDSGKFEVIGDSPMLPVIALRLLDDSRYTVFHISEAIRAKGWIVPAYTLPPKADGTAVLRIVVKENFSRDMAELFAADLQNVMQKLDASPPSHATDHGKEGHGIC
ncbi:glutamate decarboxylase [Oceanidesulfovibrio marinus]|uniref:Glutamate decarboxylase n=1 Tax=Oceanidesulfovibrio marinus TaxID=370038 RepID=A0A6P1ZFD3_9BACT|nr:glutamate decarboxylase [Oceanidesulfovibrio marinus]